MNTYTTGDQTLPSIAGNGLGGLVVAWHSYGSPGTDTDYTSILARLLNAGGSAPAVPALGLPAVVLLAASRRGRRRR